MADNNLNDDLPHLIMGLSAQQHRKINMNKILSFLKERNYSKYKKCQLLRRLYEVESDGRVSDAKQQAINLWLRRGSIGPISVYYNQNKRSQHSQASRVLKRKRSVEPTFNDYRDVRIKHEDSMEPELQPELKECSICAEDLVLADFPHHISAECMHDPTCCNSCLSRSIGMQIESKQWDQITCPECSVLLSFGNVKFFASETDFIRYDKNSLSSCIRSDPNFTNCLGPACSDGQIHEGGDDQPIMTCGTCGFKTCFTHKRPWHTDLTCDEYDVQSRNRLREEEESQILMDKATKRCPNCQVRIEKNDGCDHMTCRSCKHEFCWICFVDYKLIRSRGNAAHQSICQYYTGNLPQHPDQAHISRLNIARFPTPGPVPPRTVFTPQLNIMGRIRASQTQQGTPGLNRVMALLNARVNGRPMNSYDSQSRPGLTLGSNQGRPASSLE